MDVGYIPHPYAVGFVASEVAHKQIRSNRALMIGVGGALVGSLSNGLNAPLFHQSADVFTRAAVLGFNQLVQHTQGQDIFGEGWLSHVKQLDC